MDSYAQSPYSEYTEDSIGYVGGNVSVNGDYTLQEAVCSQSTIPYDTIVYYDEHGNPINCDYPNDVELVPVEVQETPQSSEFGSEYGGGYSEYSQGQGNDPDYYPNATDEHVANIKTKSTKKSGTKRSYTRANVGIKVENFDSKKAKTLASRPGKKPKIPDENLNVDDLQKRTARRKRNREAASRCRERRLAKMDELEGNKTDLITENSRITAENQDLKNEIEQLKLQLAQVQQVQNNNFVTFEKSSPTALKRRNTPRALNIRHENTEVSAPKFNEVSASKIQPAFVQHPPTPSAYLVQTPTFQILTPGYLPNQGQLQFDFPTDLVMNRERNLSTTNFTEIVYSLA